MISIISSILALFLFVIGLVFLPIKLFRKDLENPTYNKLYKIHVNAPKIATILAFVHGFTVSTVTQIDLVSGWVFGIASVILLLMGAYMTIKTNSTPFDEQGDIDWRTSRILKWFISVIAIVALVLHFIL